MLLPHLLQEDILRLIFHESQKPGRAMLIRFRHAKNLRWAALPVLFAHALLGSAQTIEINVATAYAPENFHTKNLQTFADDVAKATNGKVTFKIHAGGSLIKPAEIFAGVRADCR